MNKKSTGGKDEIAILILTHNSPIETAYFLDNIICNTQSPYRLHIFDYQSELSPMKDMLMKAVTDNNGYYKHFTEELSKAEIYNEMLKTVYQDYAVIVPINFLVNKNWLTDLKYNYAAVKNSGAVGILSNHKKAYLSAEVYQNDLKKEDEMKTIWVNSTNMNNDLIFFKSDRIKEVGEFDTRLKYEGLEKAEWSYRFLGNGYSNFCITKNTVISYEIDNQFLFPKISDQAKKELKEQMKIMYKVKQYKK
tara:strand:- start:930 stop:1676 length:747 start_codon:yes stop_codon:yes gene_type:complete